MNGQYMGDACCESIAKASSIGRYIPPTKRQKLEAMKLELEAGLERVNGAIAALDAHPDLEEFQRILENAGV